VAVAALSLGGVGGYAIARRSSQPASTVQGPPVDTEVAIVPERPSEPPARSTEPSRDVQPAARIDPAEPGRLVVRSVPAGALVTVDGRIAGETPITVTDLSLGPHTLVIARPGYVPRTERVALSARSVSRTVTVELRPGMDVRTAPFGSIYVDSRPRGARVLVDGRLVGTTPLGLPELGGGEHRVQMEMDGYLPHTTTVHVRPGEQTRLAVSLARGRRP
jgi:hypothetical protein